MKTNHILLAIAIITGSILASFDANAQTDERAPGIYAVVDGQSTPLTFIIGSTSAGGVGALGIEVGKKKVNFKGETSDTKATDTFVLVIDQEKKHATKTFKVYDPFYKDMTPDALIIIPLQSSKNKRVYDEGVSLNGFQVEKKARVPFEWEMISDNSFKISAPSLVPGEYGIAFKPAKLAEFDLTTIFQFTVEEPQAE